MLVSSTLSSLIFVHFEKINVDETMSVCVSVARHISETSDRSDS